MPSLSNLKLDSVRDLKWQYFGADQFASPIPLDETLLAAGRPQSLISRAPGIAPGVAPARKAGDFALAVRVQRRSSASDQRISELADIARGEIRVAYVGRGTKQVFSRFGTGRDRVRPLTIGCSIGHHQITAGTLGCFVEDGRGVHILSNNHVLADEDRAVLGDPIIQPGPYDGGVMPTDRVATLSGAVPLDMGNANRMDAAVALLADDVNYDPRVSGVGAFGAVMAAAELDGTETVAKLGRTSGLTHGRIAAFEVDGIVMEYERGRMIFNDVIEVEGMHGSFTHGGDSGSVVYVEGAVPRPLGLHFGALHDTSVVSPLAPVLQSLGVTLVT